MYLSGGNCAEEKPCPQQKPKACAKKPKCVKRRDIPPGCRAKRPVCKRERKCVPRRKACKKETRCVQRTKCADENGRMNPRQVPVVPPQESQPEGGMAATLADMGIDLVDEKIGCGSCGKSDSLSKKKDEKKKRRRRVARKCGE